MARRQRQPQREPVLSDTELIDWLSSRGYVEATRNGYQDPQRFEWNAMMSSQPLRQALSLHIRRFRGE